ncbi:unnamed protein product [Cyprideis torosa]|uniref:Methylthioribose-1-phosphate isomerase n=1 Tax=Cyprideis torosa TaxID=163714 RepID=A0A7R8WGC6_9CRUS|nr:unnamed protein product [Cyprideis torosa]CAG0898035.1 unnamed protein product [Cyprideis torosa]
MEFKFSMTSLLPMFFVACYLNVLAVKLPITSGRWSGTSAEIQAPIPSKFVVPKINDRVLIVAVPGKEIQLGMNAKALQEILSTSTSRCWSMDTYNPVPGTLEGVPSANQYQRGFLVQLITKDLGLAQDAATTSASPTPMGSLAHQIFRTMMEHGLAEKDFSVVYKFLKGQKPEDPDYLLRLILEIMTLEAIKYNNGKLRILDQLRLPEESIFIEIETVEDGWNAINKMQVRGAPAIAIVGCLSLAVELHTVSFQTHYDLLSWVTEKVDYLVTSRPTAVNLAKTVSNLKRKIAKWIEEESELDPEDIRRKVIYTIEDMLASDLADNQAIGMHGAEAILKYYTEVLRYSFNFSSILDTVLINEGFRILTHCNTGSLATSGYGTALGIIRRLSEINRLNHVYCTETRPYNQGARLTAYELVFDRLPGTLICDSAVASLMATEDRRPHAVVVGADRVTRNGDTANKIGTLQLAILCRHFGIPFYVAAPFSSIDFDLETGGEITIEERSPEEVTHVAGTHIAAPGIGVWNPAFDVTPAELITMIVTEKGLFRPSELQSAAC